MKIRKWIGCSTAGILSLGVHGALAAVFFASGEEPEMVGGHVAGEIALGTGFADLVQGSIQPVAARTPMPMPKTATTPQIKPTATELPRVTSLPQPSIKPVVTPVQVVQNAPVETSVTKITAKPKANPSTRGNAKVNSKVGQDNGTAAGKKAQSSAQKGQAKQVGQGAERTYKRKVLRKIARVPKKRTGAKGLALVGMVIAADGRIASVGIVRSSGHSGIDQMAIETVRRARGFDPTPTGARMKLVVEMKSKG